MSLRAFTLLFTLAAAVGPASGVVLADPYPLPAGFERFMYPQAASEVVSLYDVGNDYAGPWANVYGKKGFRPIDVEIEAFNPKPSTKNINKAGNWQPNVSVVSVENEGPLKSEAWMLQLATSQKQIDMMVEDQSVRLIDLDCYYRKDPFTDKIVATYALIWVLNEKHHYSPWDWIPATPYDVFMTMLDQKYDEGKRPYDIDLTVDQNGQVMGTALLAPVLMSDILTNDPETDTYAVDAFWQWFDPHDFETLNSYAQQGYQLADVEVPISGLKGGPFGNIMAEYAELDWRFGIFVKKMFNEDSPSIAGLFIHQGSLNLPPLARLFDLEVDGVLTDDSGGAIQQATIFQETQVFQLPIE